MDVTPAFPRERYLLIWVAVYRGRRCVIDVLPQHRSQGVIYRRALEERFACAYA
jgi:hypothetical protein